MLLGTGGITRFDGILGGIQQVNQALFRGDEIRPNPESGTRLGVAKPVKRAANGACARRDTYDAFPLLQQCR